VGLARGITAINRKVIASIFMSWFVTIPVSAGLTVLFYIIAKWLFW
jgi:PiT family inorganic phosphate transporter